MIRATTNSETNLNLLDLALQNEAEGVQMFASSRTNPGKLYLHLSKDAVTDPQNFVDSIFRFASAINTKPYIAEGVRAGGLGIHFNSSQLPKGEPHPTDADLETLDQRIIEILSTISPVTIEKAASAFINFCKELPEKSRLFKQSLGEETSSHPPESSDNVISAMQHMWDQALSAQERALLERCETAQHIADRFLPSIIARIDAEPVLAQKDAKVLEKIIETTEAAGFGSFDKDRSYTLKRTGEIISLVMAGVAHLSRKQQGITLANLLANTSL